MPDIPTSTEAVEELIQEACARNTPAELHYETRDGTIVTCRVRLLDVTDDHVLADAPSYPENSRRIPSRQPITIHLLLDGFRFQFDSEIETAIALVRLNDQTRIPGIKLRKPTTVADSQRRFYFRISLLGKETINVDMVRCEPDFPDACPIDAGVIPGQLVNLSAGGMAVLVDRSRLRTAKRNDCFYLSFSLPGIEREFCMLGSARHVREIQDGTRLRLGIAFEPWAGAILTHDQRILARFIADCERRLLRRKK